jgi:hypothetical protein
MLETDARTTFFKETASPDNEFILGSIKLNLFRYFPMDSLWLYDFIIAQFLRNFHTASMKMLINSPDFISSC